MRKLKGFRAWAAWALLFLGVAAVSGCQTLKFYAQAARGEYQLLSNQRPVEKLEADPATPARLKERLELIDRLRQFALTELKLPVDGHYRKYVDLHRRFVVWNVEAAPEFSMKPKTWWYPLVGSLDYRGYFSEPIARKYGAKLENKGYDVFVPGITAYSTLGWFKDPLLNTFIFDPEQDLAETLFHELGHQRVFARGDTDFNEAFATTVGQTGARRWLRQEGNPARAAAYETELHRNWQYVHLVAGTRAKLEALFGDQRTPDGKIETTDLKKNVPREEMRAAKRRIYDELKEGYARLKAEWGGDTSYDYWFEHQLNNAQLNSVAAYYDLVPAFERILDNNGGDLEKFYSEVERLSKLPKKSRDEQLQALLPVRK